MRRCSFGRHLFYQQPRLVHKILKEFSHMAVGKTVSIQQVEHALRLIGKQGSPIVYRCVLAPALRGQSVLARQSFQLSPQSGSGRTAGSFALFGAPMLLQPGLAVSLARLPVSHDGCSRNLLHSVRNAETVERVETLGKAAFAAASSSLPKTILSHTLCVPT